MDDEVVVLTEAAKGESSRQKTAKRAAQILVGKNEGFRISTAKQKQNLLVAFAKRNLVIYGNAFDALKLRSPVDLDSLSDIEKHLDDIMLYEIKSTNRDIGADFSGYFFALTTAELLVAQNLKNRYKFVFVNVTTENFIELALTDVFAICQSQRHLPDLENPILGAHRWQSRPTDKGFRVLPWVDAPMD